ncbi:hypothetical protein DS901_11500 [Loktanella sp. D2R18]|uniref:hypothetical protein n=1 Tax=Rhodobacterales TaxID=204455 RepID=UPI000DE8F619|nr:MULTISPECIES: hypothetical protein [Rhodobacterales]MDO6590329.1 hypothetical protein [Yoonia sp. 1_MG-2023]RBW42868.1 hypothetical protein DS901_11500 [Loktanella sp. D2R18]
MTRLFQVLIATSCIAIGQTVAAQDINVCGMRDARFNAQLEAVLEQDWLLQIGPSVAEVSGAAIPDGFVSPLLNVTLSLDNGTLVIQGEGLRREFVLDWEHEKTANFDAPDPTNPAYSNFPDTGEVDTLFECGLAGTPFLSGYGVSTNANAPQLSIYLWIQSNTSMMGMSVAKVRNGAARSMLRLWKVEIE